MHRVPVVAAPPRPDRPCWHCAWFARMVHGGSAAWCNLPNAPRVQAGPREGCSAWERVPGVDDEPGPPAPAGLPRASQVKPLQQPATPVAWAP